MKMRSKVRDARLGRSDAPDASRLAQKILSAIDDYERSHPELGVEIVIGAMCMAQHVYIGRFDEG